MTDEREARERLRLQALEAYEIAGDKMVDKIAKGALSAVRTVLRDTAVSVDIIIIDRAGNIIAKVGE